MTTYIGSPAKNAYPIYYSLHFDPHLIFYRILAYLDYNCGCIPDVGVQRVI